MSHSTDVRTPGLAAIAKKWNLPIAKVIALVNKGAEVEKEHTKSLAKAKQVARDHIAERPDYYAKLKKMEKSPISMKEETGVGSVRGFGNVSGDPAVGSADYVTTNSLAYDPFNGALLNFLNKAHNKLHKKETHKFFNPTAMKDNKNFVNEGISAGPERESEIIGDLTGAPRKMDKVEEDKGPCWKGYEMVGMKKKRGKEVPNCVPVKEGWASIGHPYDFGGDVNHKTKFYGKKPKPTTTKNDEKDDTYKGSKQGDTNVNKVKPVKEEIRVTKWSDGGHTARVSDKGEVKGVYSRKDWSKLNKEIKSRFGVKGNIPQGEAPGKAKDRKIDEDAVTVAATQHMDAARGGEYRPARASQGRVTFRGSTAHVKGASYQSGTGSARSSLGSGGYSSASQQMKPSSTNVPTRFMRSVKNAPSTQGAGGQLKPTSTSGSSSFTPNSQSRSMNVGKGMSASKQTSPVVKGMSAAGQEASKKIVPKAAGVVGAVGKVARAMSGPEGAAVTAAAEPLAKKMASSFKAGHQSFKPHGDEGEKFSDVAKRMKQPEQQKPQGRSVSDYEKQTLTPKSYEAPKAPENPKVDAPTPPSRPEYFSRGQAFSAARKEAGGGEGKFSYQGGSDTTPKSYQTNVEKEPYKPSSQLKQTSVQEDWQKVNRRDKTDGLSQKAVNAYRRENPGSNLQTAVTEKNPSGKRAARRKSFCSRMGGMKKRLTSAKTARDPDSRINKALRRWNCEESTMNEFWMPFMTPHHKHSARLSKEKSNKPDVIVDPGGKKGQTIVVPTKGLREETKMDNNELINEAIENILDNNLTGMKDNLMEVLQEKTMEKLEERKKVIAANYFSQ